jgi:serine/threonine-protein kinase
MASGKPPFSADSPVAIAYKHVQEPIPPLAEKVPGIPRDYEAITNRALAKDPDDRYADGAAMRADLLRFREGKPIAAVTPVPTGPARPPSPPTPPAGTPVTVAEPAVVPAEPARKRTGWFFVVILLLLVVLAGLLFAFGQQLGVFEAQTKKVAVPDVVDLDQATAKARLEDVGLKVELSDTESDKPEGTVTEQSPAAGKQVDEGSTVILQVSVGVGKATVPNVEGMNEAAARAELKKAGFENVGPPVQEESDLQEPGNVIRTDPAKDQQVAKDTLITLYIAKVVETTTTEAPPSTTQPPPSTTAPPPVTTTTAPPVVTTTTQPIVTTTQPIVTTTTAP